MTCIFVEDQYPERCSVCLEARKLDCLRTQRGDMKVTKQGAEDLHKELEREIQRRNR